MVFISSVVFPFNFSPDVRLSAIPNSGLYTAATKTFSRSTFFGFVTGIQQQDLLLKKNGAEEVVGVATTGDLCGEIGVLCYRPQLFTVRTKRLSQLLRLNRSTFFNIVKANVESGTIIMNNLLQHLKDVKEPIMQNVLNETTTMLARGRMDLPLTVAVLGGDDSLLHKLLRQGLNINESLSETETMLARRRKDLPPSLYSAASRGDDLLLRQLLK